MSDAHNAIDGAQVLIIDDHRALAENLGELLAEAGAVVEEAGNATEGLERARLGFDIALVDVRLPDTLGLALVPRLRALDPLAAVVLITGHASIDDAISAVRAGAYAYVLKPFDSGELLVTVGRAIEQVRLARRAAGLQRALERSEAELRTLVDTVEALLLVLDERGHVMQANAAVAAATGVPIHELRGADWVERFVPRAEHDTVTATLARVRAGNSGVALESRVLGRHGDQIYEHLVRWRLAGLATENGFRIYASGLDMTDVRALERRTRLAEKLAAVGTVSAGLAHEIRNPLNAAGLQLQLLERRLAKLGEDDSRLREPLALVNAEIARLSRLVSDFLQFARPTPLQARDIAIDQVVARVVAFEQPVARERDIELVMRVVDGPVVIEADSERMQQVAHNLVRNALDAAPRGGHVIVAVERDGAGARLSVRDDGPGIRAEHRQRIFEPFFTTKEGGTGLGMAIVHSLVELHGGTLELRCDAGTELVVALPRHVP